MKTKNPSLTALTLLSFLAVSASAQVAGSASAGATSAAGAAGVSPAAPNSTTPTAPTALPPTPTTLPPASTSLPQTPTTLPATPTTMPPMQAPNPNVPHTLDPANPLPPGSVDSSPNAAAQNSAAMNQNTLTAAQRASSQPLSADVAPGANPAVNPTAAEASRIGADAASTANSSMIGTTNSAVSAGASRSGAISTPTGSTTADAVNSSLAGSAAATGDVRSSEIYNRNPNVSPDATINGSNLPGRPGISGVVTGSEYSNSAASILSPSETVQDIRDATQSSRDALYTQINGRLENSGRIISELDNKGRELKGDARTLFKAATDDLRDKEKALKRSLNDVRKASNDTWSDAQARLAADYEAYAAAVARAQAAANMGSASPTMGR